MNLARGDVIYNSYHGDGAFNSQRISFLPIVKRARLNLTSLQTDVSPICENLRKKYLSENTLTSFRSVFKPFRFCERMHTREFDAMTSYYSYHCDACVQLRKKVFASLPFPWACERVCKSCEYTNKCFVRLRKLWSKMQEKKHFRENSCRFSLSFQTFRLCMNLWCLLRFLAKYRICNFGNSSSGRDARVSYHRIYNAPRITTTSRFRTNTISFLRKENRCVSVSTVCISAYMFHNFQIHREREIRVLYFEALRRPDQFYRRAKSAFARQRTLVLSREIGLKA